MHRCTEWCTDDAQMHSIYLHVKYIVILGLNKANYIV